MSDSTIASISIPVRIDFSEFNRDLQQLQRLPAIAPTVKLDQLHELNRVLDIKQKHIKETVEFARRNTIVLYADTSAIRRATKEIQDFQATIRRGTYELPTIKQKVELEINGTEIEKIFRKSAGSANLGNIFSGLLNTPFKLVAEAGKQVFIGAFQAVGTPLGKELGKGLKDGIERELSYSVGSMSLIGRKMGEALSSEIANVMSEELGVVGQIMRDLMGQADVVRSGADVRNKQRVQTQRRNESGSEQLNREFDFFTANSAEIRAKSLELDAKRREIARLDREIQSRVNRTAEALGLSGLQQQRKDIQSQRSQYSERLKQGDIPVDEQKMISLQLQRLNAQDRNAFNRIEDVQKIARRRFQAEIDRISTIKDEFLAEENRFLRVVSAPDRVEFAVKRNQQQKPEVKPDHLPQIYLSVVRQVAEMTGTKIKNNQIPQLRVDDALSGINQNYDPRKNAVSISQEVNNQLSTGTASEKAVENLIHELVHAVQFKFGEITDVSQAGRKGQLSPNADEARKLGANIERSTGSDASRRALEADAYTFAYRNKDDIYARVIREQTQRSLENTLGVGGGKASLEITKGAMEGFGKLQKYSSVAPMDVTYGLQESIGQIEAIRNQVLAGLQKLDNIDLLGTDEIEKIQKEILQSVQSGIQEIQAVTEEFKQKLLTNPQSLTQPFNPEFIAKETEAVTVERLKQQTQAVSSRRTVDPAATSNLTEISQAITNKSLESDALNKVKATSDYFVQSYKNLKASIAKGGQQAQKDLDLFVRAVTQAQKEIDSIVSGLKSEGVDADFASKLGGKLQGLKGQLSAKRNTAQRLANRQNISQTSDDQSLYAFEDIQTMFNQARKAVLGQKRLDPDVLMFKTEYSKKAYDEAEIGIENQYNKAYEQVNFSLENMGKAAETTTSKIKRIIQSNLDPSTAFGGFIEGIKGVTTALVGFGTAGVVIAVLGNIARSTTKAGLELDSLERRFKSIEGSRDAGDNRLDQLREQSDLLGVSFTETAKAYAQFASVTKDTPLEGFQTQQISEALSISSGSRGLTNERQRLVNTGFAQMLSKGVVSQEEIRGQIAESMPGFIQTAARAHGVSVPELNRMIKGGMESDKFAVRVTQQLQAESQGASAEASKSPQAAFNRLGNANEELMGRAGQRFLPMTALGAETAATAINLLANNIDKLLQLLATVSTTATTFGFQGLIQSSGLLSTAITFVSTQVMSLISNLNKMMPVIGRFVLITAAIEGFKILQTALSDSGGQFREFANASESSLKRYEQALSKANGTQADFISKLPKKVSDVNGTSYLEDSIVGGLADKEFFRSLENNKVARAVFDGLNVQTSLLPNRAQKENKDSMKAMDDQLAGMDKTSQSIRDQLSSGNSQLKQLIEVDKQIEEIQAKRRGISVTSKDPGVKDPQLDQLKSQEEELNKKRTNILAPIAELQKKAAEEVINAEKAIEGLQTKVQDGSITQDQYNQKIGAYSDRLKTAKANQDALNISLRDSLSKLTAFEKAWQKISDISIDAQKQIEISGSSAQTQVLQQELNGSQNRGTTDDQIKRIQNDIAIQQQSRRQTELLQKKAELDAQDAAKVFANFGITEATRQSELKTLAENATGEREKKIIQSYSEYLTLKDQITQGEQQINQAKVESARQITELSKSVDEYYRNIQRNSESLALDLKSMDLNTKLLGQRAKIKGAFTGFYSTFVDEFADGIMSIFEMMNEQSQKQIEANRQIMQRMQGLDDTLRQGSELGQTIPGGSVGGSLASGAFGSGLYTAPESRNGGSAAYHIDTKFHRTMSDDQILQMMDQIAAGYEAVGRKIEFSNNAVAGEVYDRNDPNRMALLKRAKAAHSHSTYSDWDSIDYYIPKKSGNRFDSSAEGAEILLPTVAGGKVEYGSGGRYGNYALIYNSKGELIAKTGHGDDGKALPQSRSFAQTQVQTPALSSGNIGSVGGFDPSRINTSVSILQQKGLTPLAAAYLTGSFMQESGGAGWEKADNGTHRGIMQWQKGVRDIGLPSDFAGQVAYAVTEAMQDSPQHVATLKNPNATPEQVKKAIEGFTRWGTGEEKSRFVYGQQIYQQMGKGGLVNPTTGMTQGSVAEQERLNSIGSGLQTKVSDAGKTAIADAEKFASATYAQLEAQGKLSAIQIEDAKKKNVQRARQGVLDTERSVIDQERRLADIRNNLGDSTPERELRNQLLGVERQRQDSLKDINPQYEKLTQSLEHSRSLLGIIDKLPGFESQAEALRKAIPELERLQKHLGEAKKRINDTYGAQSQDLISKFSRAQREARIEIEAQIKQSEVELRAKQNESLRLNVRGQYQQSQFDYVSGVNALPSMIANEQASLNQKLLGLEKQRREGQLTNEEFEKLSKTYTEISKVNLQNAITQVQKLREASEVERENFQFGQYQSVYESQSKLMNAQKSGYGLYGLQTQQNILDKEMGKQSIEFDYQSQVKQLNDLMRSGSLASGTALELKTNLDALKTVQLDNLEKQFDPMTKAITDTKGAFQGLLTDLFNGQKSFLESLADFAKNVANNLFAQFAQEATDEIFGGFLGKGRKKAEADAKGGFETLGVFKDRTNTEANFPLMVQQSAQQFLEFSKLAAEEIRQAGRDFADIVRSQQEFSQQFLNSDNYGFASAEYQMNPFDTPAKAMESTFKYFDNPALTFSENIVDGANMAASILSESGTNTSKNLLGNLSQGLPSLIGDVVGLFGGKGSGGILGSVVGITSSLFGGGSKAPSKGVGGNIGSGVLGIATKLLGFAEGGIIPGMRSKEDDQLILAQRGEAVLTHRAVDILGENRIKLLNKGRLPKFAEGGIVGRGNLGLTNMPDSGSPLIRNRNTQANSGVVQPNVSISVTINNDGTSQVSGDSADQLGGKLTNAVKAILVQELRPNGLLTRR